MQITRQTEYAIRTLIELAGLPEHEIVQSRTIAQKNDLPEKFLNKTVQLLVKAGLVETRRGMNGGIKLAVRPELITAADVLKAIEGKIAINPCLVENYYCKHKENCGFHSVLQRTQDAMIAELSKSTIADMVLEQYSKNCLLQQAKA
jgi:Rrf2 family protein